MTTLNIVKFKDAVCKLENIIADPNKTWDQKHSIIFEEPHEVLDQILIHGYIDGHELGAPLSNKGEVLRFRDACRNKLDYLGVH